MSQLFSDSNVLLKENYDSKDCFELLEISAIMKLV